MQVLIIDDNPTNLFLLKKMTEKMDGCQPYAFSDAPSALDWCAGKVADLVLVDYMMPEMDGITFIREFRQIKSAKDVPVIMVTADVDKAVRYEALENGATDFLNKPIDKTEFMARMKNMLALRRSQKQLANRAEWLANEVRKATKELKKRELEAILLLSKAAEYRDPETASHIVRMSHYSRLIARHLGMDAIEQEMIMLAAPMHDVGKLGTPDRILLKPAKLTDEEFAIMRQHAEHGYEILRHSETRLLQVAAEIAYMHHEKVDGSGYPQGLKGDAISLYARIVAVADVFDALTSERPYKKAWPVEKAVAVLQQDKGSHFDPACVDALVEHLDEALEIKAKFQDDAAA